MRVNKGVGDACLVQDQMQILDVVASRAEHDRLLPGRNDFLEQVEKRGNLALFPAVEERHSKRLRDLCVDIEPEVDDEPLTSQNDIFQNLIYREKRFLKFLSYNF